MNIVALGLCIMGIVFLCRIPCNLWYSDYKLLVVNLIKSLVVLLAAFGLFQSVKYFPIEKQYTKFDISKTKDMLVITEYNCYVRAYNVSVCKEGTFVTYNLRDLFNDKRVTQYDMQAIPLTK
jgi:hypothetical protein